MTWGGSHEAGVTMDRGVTWGKGHIRVREDAPVHHENTTIPCIRAASLPSPKRGKGREEEGCRGAEVEVWSGGWV